MLTSIRRNNMALSAGSHSADTMFDFFEEKADTTANTVQPVNKDGQGTVSNHQPSDPTKVSGREVTDISFQSIEEVIELEGDNNGTPEIELFDGSSGVFKVEPGGKMIGLSENHSQRSQLTEYKNVRQEKDRNGTISVLSLLSNISLTENKPNEETANTHKSHTEESVSSSASLSERSRAKNERDAPDTIAILAQGTAVSTQDKSTTNTPGIENELSFSWLKNETKYQKSQQNIPTKSSPSSANLKDMKESVDSLNEDEINATDRPETESGERRLVSESKVQMEKDDAGSVVIPQLPSVKPRTGPDFSGLTTENDVTAAKTTVNTLSRSDSNRVPDLSWLTGDKDTQKSESETIFPSEHQKDTSFSWLKSDRDVNETESELKHGKRAKSKKEDFSWLTSDKEIREADSASVVTNSLSNSNNAKKEISWLSREKDTPNAKSISDLSSISSLGDTRILPSTETKEKPDSGWNVKEPELSLSRLQFQEGSSRTSSTEELSSSKETKSSRHSGSNTHPESKREHGHIPTMDEISFENTGEKKQNTSCENTAKSEQNFLKKMKDLNFDFMDEERIQSETPGDVPTRGATTISLSTSQSPLSVHQADVLYLDDKQAEGDTKQSQSSSVSEAIHSAVARFHHEKGVADTGVSKPVGKKKKKSVRQNGSKQANVRKKASKTDKVTTGTVTGSGLKDKAFKNQNTNKADTGKSKNLQKTPHEVESNDPVRSKKLKPHNDVETQGKESKNDNGNSNQADGYHLPAETSASSEEQTSTMASSDTVIKIDNMSNYSLAYEDDFEDDNRSVKSVASSKAGFESDSQKKGEHFLAYSSSPYGGIYSAYARQPKQPIRSDNVKFPIINALNPVQLTSGQSSCSQQIFSASVKRKRKSKKKEIFTKESYEYKASSESDSKPEIVLRKSGRVPVSLKAEAVYRKGRLDIAVVDDRQALSEGANMDVRITVVHKHLNGLQVARNRPRKLPKLNFAANRDILNHRAALPPFNTHTDKQASERFKQTFGM